VAIGLGSNKGSFYSAIKIIVVFILCLVIFVNAEKPITDNPVQKDSEQYLAMAFNLYKHKTISLAKDNEQIKPTSFREPVYPTLLALYIGIREAILVLGLLPFLPSETIIVLVSFHRLIYLGLEIILAAVGYKDLSLYLKID